MSVSEDCQEQLDFKDMKLQMLLVSLKELTATKEVIQTLEQLLCDESTQLQEERRQVSIFIQNMIWIIHEKEIIVYWHVGSGYSQP